VVVDYNCGEESTDVVKVATSRMRGSLIDGLVEGGVRREEWV
jgi:hypothetical protein